MSNPDAGAGASPPWASAALAAALFAVDPVGLHGVSLRSLAGPARDRWLGLLKDYLPEGAPMRRIPTHITDSRLLGGLDLAATLRSAKPVAERGVLVEADGGVVLLAMAERLSAGTAGRIGAVLDRGEVQLERDGLGMRSATRIGVVALDEGLAEDERPPVVLTDRFAFLLDLHNAVESDLSVPATDPATVAAARERLASITIPDDIVGALCSAAVALGIASVRASLMAVKAARAAAALAGHESVTQEDAATAASLVLGPRATIMPAGEPQEDEPPPEEPPPPEPSEPENPEEPQDEDDSDTLDPQELEEMMIAVAQAAIPDKLLAQLREGRDVRSRAQSSNGGKAGAAKKKGRRGRPSGVRAGEPTANTRLNIIETLRAAAPWQPIRRVEAAKDGRSATLVEVRRSDFRCTHFKQRSETTTIFVVDASGSSALQRLAEAKGAVELLLADCYVRRDNVALVAFRGKAAEVLLPPTRSLVRAKRSLAGLPGGGGTPLASAIDTAGMVATGCRDRGQTPVLVFLTDGQGNIARDGTPGRPQAEKDAIESAQVLRVAGFATMLIDTARRPQAMAQKLAAEMGAKYLLLPYADAAAMSKAVRATTADSVAADGRTRG
jgi:magnesium chelatase subunit D